MMKVATAKKLTLVHKNLTKRVNKICKELENAIKIAASNGDTTISFSKQNYTEKELEAISSRFTKQGFQIDLRHGYYKVNISWGNNYGNYVE